MTLAERTRALLDRAHLDPMPATYRSLVIAMARTEGLESGELKRLSPHWYNIGRYEAECLAWEASQAALEIDAESLIVAVAKTELQKYKAAWVHWQAIR